MLLKNNVLRPQLVLQGIKLLNIGYSIVCSFNLVMILLYHTSVKYEMKVAAAYAFCYTILWLFLPTLTISLFVFLVNKIRVNVRKAVLDNHLKFVFMAITTFLVLNAHNFILSLLK